MTIIPTRTFLGVIAGGALLATGAIAAPGTAFAATAPTTVTVTSLPANVSITAADTVQVTVPNSALCAAGVTLNAATIAGRQDAVSVTVPALCTGGTLTATVKPTGSAKRNAVVKFTGTSTTQDSTSAGTLVVRTIVGTLVVRISKPRPGKPA